MPFKSNTPSLKYEHYFDCLNQTTLINIYHKISFVNGQINTKVIFRHFFEIKKREPNINLFDSHFNLIKLVF